MLLDLMLDLEEPEEELSLGFAQIQRPPNVDFVISPPYYMRLVQVYREVLTTVQADRRDDSELQEMMQMYAAANKTMRKAA